MQQTIHEDPTLLFLLWKLDIADLNVLHHTSVLSFKPFYTTNFRKNETTQIKFLEIVRTKRLLKQKGKGFVQV